MEEYILDTNILIYMLEGRGTINKTLNNLYREYFFISVVSCFECLEGAKNKKDHILIEQFLKTFVPLDLNFNTMKTALDLYKKSQRRIKFKDLLIAGTAFEENLTLVTADKDFKKIKGLKVKFVNL